jgi:hypothetical protein
LKKHRIGKIDLEFLDNWIFNTAIFTANQNKNPLTRLNQQEINASVYVLKTP